MRTITQGTVLSQCEYEPLLGIKNIKEKKTDRQTIRGVVHEADSFQ